MHLQIHLIYKCKIKSQICYSYAYNYNYVITDHKDTYIPIRVC